MVLYVEIWIIYYANSRPHFGIIVSMKNQPVFRQWGEGIGGLDVLQQTALDIFQYSLRIHMQTQKPAV